MNAKSTLKLRGNQVWHMCPWLPLVISSSVVKHHPFTHHLLQIWETPFGPTCWGMLALGWGSWREDGGSQQLTMCGFSLKYRLSSQCQAWWKPEAAVAKVTSIVTGVACCTRLLSRVQMVGNVPDLPTLLWDWAAGVPQPLQASNLLPCVYWM